MKRVSLMVLVLIISAVSCIYADSSDWAKEFVDSAIEEQLVPEVLQNDYQEDILRYEYVLLALKILEQQGLETSIKTSVPFNDISGFDYEYSVVRAYNFGLINGYEDGSFRPYNKITRQEIDALVFRLLHLLKKDVELTSKHHPFSDKHLIADWALPYVDFCYEHQIMNGIGKVNNLPTINPKGNATREESVTLLYRMIHNKNFFGEKHHSHHISQAALNDFLAIAEKENVKISYKTDASISLIFDDKSSFSVITYESRKHSDHLYFEFTDINNIALLDDMIRFSKNNMNVHLKPVFDHIIQNVKENNEYTDINHLGKHGEYIFHSQNTDKGKIYMFSYEEERGK